MADTTPRLKRIKEQIRELASLAASDQAEAARRLAEELNAELDQALQESTTRPANAAPPRHSPPKAPRDDVARCPICSLRSFRFQKGTVRESPKEEGRYEGFYRCQSCAHEAWCDIG
ncbi:hypothetical protein HOP52_07310 [Halomonas campisalis]|uniref:TFIIS-type domain-containing protein n=1 Tax=Billgrantia campisalis TaxID=74661 RepID=A0ABS9P7X6_9GAMM|nr:hypothetical protein [Halomonas campisalis]MCG6657569.1 hypothetical protein [Halomonas campisalis]MDR5862657.1 hypothetical protein [Halomonas campisalis]